MKNVFVSICLLALLCLVFAPLANAQQYPNIPTKAGEQMYGSDGEPIEGIDEDECNLITHGTSEPYKIRRKWNLVSTEAAHKKYFALEDPVNNSREFPVWGEQVVYEWLTDELPEVTPYPKSMKMATNGLREEVVRKSQRKIYEVKVTRVQTGYEEQYEKGKYVPR